MNILNKYKITLLKLLIALTMITLSIGFISGHKTHQDTPNINQTSEKQLNPGIFHLELQIPKNSSEKVKLIKFNLNESASMKPGKAKTTGSKGITHSIKLLNKDKQTLEERKFGLYTESIPDRRAINGSYVTTQPEKKYFDKHIFKFKRNLSATKIEVYQGNQKIYSLNIPQKICTEKEYNYCKNHQKPNKTAKNSEKPINNTKINKSKNKIKKLINRILNLFLKNTGQILY